MITVWQINLFCFVVTFIFFFLFLRSLFFALFLFPSNTKHISTFWRNYLSALYIHGHKLRPKKIWFWIELFGLSVAGLCLYYVTLKFAGFFLLRSYSELLYPLLAVAMLGLYLLAPLFVLFYRLIRMVVIQICRSIIIAASIYLLLIEKIIEAYFRQSLPKVRDPYVKL